MPSPEYVSVNSTALATSGRMVPATGPHLVVAVIVVVSSLQMRQLLRVHKIYHNQNHHKKSLSASIGRKEDTPTDYVFESNLNAKSINDQLFEMLGRLIQWFAQKVTIEENVNDIHANDNKENDEAQQE